MGTSDLTATRTRLLLTGSVVGLLLAEPQAAAAQTSAPPPPEQTPPPAADGPAAADGTGQDRPSDRNVIVVIGGRTIIAALKDVTVEATYDADAVSAYGVGSVGEVLDEIRNENGDEQPSFLVNGRPVTSPEDIAALPAEAISRIEVLPRGSATKIGGTPGQRAYNVVLRPSLTSTTLTAARTDATEGGWSNTRGEVLFTWIDGQDRLNLSLRGGRSTALFESERDFVPRTLTTPWSPLGNIIPASGSQIDPALSVLYGQQVTVLALPGGLATPTLASLLPGANRTNPSGEAAYRTLRGPSQPIDINLSGNKALNEWLSLSLNARLGWTETEGFSGLPTGRFLIPATNPFTPFSAAVSLALNDPSRPLVNRADGNSQSLSATINAQRGPWHGSLTARWDRRENTYLSQATGPLGALGTVAPSINPFAGTLAATIPVTERESTSRNTNSQLVLEVQGPIFALWAGPLSSRATIGITRVDYQASDISGPRALKRTELSSRAGITVPLTSRQFGFLPALGESEFEFDYGTVDLGSYGTLTRRSLTLNWQPVSWINLVASDNREERPVAPELLAAPQVITPNVPYFDPVTGQTSDVTLISGGSANLRDEEYRVRSVAVTISPLKNYSLQFNAEYAVNEVRNQVGALPQPSSAVVAAFPDRFVRDSLGYLTVVDSRSINFAEQRSEVLRVGVRFVIPLTEAGPPVKNAKGQRQRTPPLRLTFNLTHTYVIESTAVIRTGLPEIDLLAGGANGIAGGQLRHSTRAGVALNRGGTGLRIDYDRRGESRLTTGTLAAPDLLRFEPITTFDLRAFADLGEVFPKAGIPRGTRVTLVVDNLANQRQTVIDRAGTTPQAYQPVRRDPIGRTVMVELRLAF
ncbi:MAG TPA: hypothetical protein VFV30_12515 [Novosphingobium sp.]|nr:hypothetical protein [Novosphingobium sp.]